jgi:hypothetical protein
VECAIPDALRSSPHCGSQALFGPLCGHPGRSLTGPDPTWGWGKLSRDSAGLTCQDETRRERAAGWAVSHEASYARTGAGA